MNGIMVPKARAESPTQGGGSKFVLPEGNWLGTIEKVTVKAFPDFIDPVGRPTSGYASKDGEILGIQFGSLQGLDEGAPQGINNKFFFDFVTRDGAATVEAGPDIPEKSWQMQRSATFLANLAVALGATEDVEYEGQTYVRTTDDFLQQLRDGDFNGATVGFNVYHRTWQKKEGGVVTKEGVNVELREFFQAV